MFTDVQIINLGLAKVASSRVTRIDPPSSSLERHCSEGYQMWKRTELAKRRWVFALELAYPLSKVAEVDRDDGLNIKYQLPTECLRPIRTKYTEWRQAGRFVFSGYDELSIDFIKNTPEAEFDPLFVDVLASRIALECTEYVTQSNTKKADNSTLYREAVQEAAKANAFVIGPEDVQEDDSDFSFINARYT